MKMPKFFKGLFSGRKKFAVLAFLIIVIGFFFWRAFSKKEDQVQYQTASVEKGVLVSSVSASGQVLSVNVMSANTKASGVVKKVYVKDGDRVKEGDNILEIDLDFQGEQKRVQAWSSYLSAKNSLESAKTTLYTLQSQEFAANQKFINDAVARELDPTDPTYIQQNADWLAAEAKYKNQGAVIAQAQSGVNNAWLSYKLVAPVITAPTDGIVTSLMYTEGMNIGSLDTGSSESNQKAATIKTEGNPIISVNLSEIDVSRVIPDQQAVIIFGSISDKTFTGRVVGVDRIGAASSGVTQYPAIIQLDSSSAEILPNMTVTANIIIERKDSVLIVPSGAVQDQGGQTFVSALKDSSPQFVPVEIGLTSDTETEIISGLNEGDIVVTGTSSSTGSQQGGASPFGSSGFGGMIRMAR